MKRFLTLLFIVAVIASSWLLYSYKQEKETPVPEGIKTAPVVRDSIESLISATGSIAVERTESIAFATSGKVLQVLVKEGDTVQAGQMLARLDSEDLELNLKQAQSSLRSSDAQLARALKVASETDIAAARAALESAKASLRDLEKGPSTRDKELARLAIDQAKNSLWGAQGSRDAIVGSRISSGGQRDQAEAQVLNAEVGIKIAETQYGQLFELPKESAIASAKAQIAQAEANLAKLLDMPSPEDVTVAEAQVEQARVGVEIAQKRLDDDDVTLKAPFSGQLTSWDVYVDDTVAPGTPVGTLVDTSRYHISVSIDETEIGQVEMGQNVRITLDAFPEEELGGHVSKIDLVGSNAQGIVTYGVEIELSPTELAIKPLMTAAIDIVVEELADVLVVPNRALRRDKQGKYVEILRNNVPTRVDIETGVYNEEYTQIISGLEEGQEIIVGRPRTSIFGGGPFGGG